MKIDFSNLNMWLHYQPFGMRFTENKAPETYIEDIETFSVFINSLKLRLDSSYSININEEFLEYITYMYRPHIIFKPVSLMSFDWYREVIWKFKNFLCVLMDINIFIEQWKLRMNKVFK